MKKIMYGLFQTSHSKTPYAIFHSKGNAQQFKWIKGQIIKRLELDFKQNELAVTVRLHQYSLIHKL